MSFTPSEQDQTLTALLARVGLASLPAGAAGTIPFAQTFDRRMATSSVFAPPSGTLVLTAIYLTGGCQVNGITFVSGLVGEALGSHLWYALYTNALTLVGQTPDDTGAGAFAASTALRKTLTTPQICAYSGLYYVGFCCVATTVPVLANVTPVLSALTGSISAMSPSLAATSSTGLAGIAPDPAGALTAIPQCLYAFVD